MTAEKKRTILFVIVYAVTAIALLFGCYAVYNIAFIEQPWTISTVYLSTLNYSENNKSIISVNVSGNDNNNGQAVYEMQLSSYTDSEGGATISYGIQCVGDWKIINMSDGVNAYVNQFMEFSNSNYDERYVYGSNYTFAYGNFSFYRTDDSGTTYYSINYDDIDNFLLVDINGKFYKITLKEYTFETTHEYTGWDWFTHWNKTYTVTNTAQFTWFEVFDAVMKSAIDNSGAEEFSKYGLNLFDLSKYVTIEVQNSGTQYENLPETDQNKTLLSIPVNYTKNGATEVSDSVFKMINGSTTWSYWNDTSVEDYWDVDSPINLTEKYINYIYYDAYDGYFLTIDKKLANYLKIAGANEINININCNNLTYDVLGIDLQYFNFNINTFNITNATNNFEILNQESCATVPTIMEV